MQPTRKVCALSYMPDMRLAYERIVTEARDILHILEKRFFTFCQQQFSFVNALDRCKQTVFEPTKKIDTINLVTHYAKNVSNNRTDRRVLKMFLVLVRDLQEFRRTLVRLSKQRDETLEEIFAKWKRLLEPTQDISRLRAKYPNTQINYLSVDERLNYYGGVVSVLPMAMDCARDALRRIEMTRVYRPTKTVKRNPRTDLHAPREKVIRPCMMNEKSRMPNEYCKRVPPPSSTISSPVPSSVGLPRSLPSSAMSLGQVQDCKVHRTLMESEDPSSWRHRKKKEGGARNPLAWDTDIGPSDINRCLWRNRTCSEQFVDKMITEKRKRDRKHIHCKY